MKESPVSISLKVGKVRLLHSVVVRMRGGAACNLFRIIRAQTPASAHCPAHTGLRSVVGSFPPSGRLHGGDLSMRVSSLPSRAPWELCSPVTKSPTGHLSFGFPSLQRLAFFHSGYLRLFSHTFPTIIIWKSISYFLAQILPGPAKFFLLPN